MSKIKKIMMFLLFFVGVCASYSMAAVSGSIQRVIYDTMRECLANCSGTCTSVEWLGDDGTTTTQYRCSGSCSQGEMKYKYEAIGDCGTKTSTNTCCSNGSWSGWDEDCPKDCTGEKPATSQACFSGYQTRTVTCVNGSWQTGTWSECDCTNSQYEWVDLPDNQGKCCQDTRCGTTGPNGEAYICCARGQEEIPWNWVKGGNVYCNGFDQGSSVESCGTCDERNNGAECRVSNKPLFGAPAHEPDCTLYMCRRG